MHKMGWDWMEWNGHSPTRQMAASGKPWHEWREWRKRDHSDLGRDGRLVVNGRHIVARLGRGIAIVAAAVAVTAAVTVTVTVAVGKHRASRRRRRNSTRSRGGTCTCTCTDRPARDTCLGILRLGHLRIALGPRRQERHADNRHDGSCNDQHCNHTGAQTA
ncbi:hypothetical protein BC831DRAFT_478308 [Entophlyctis helioformis]|nr:hypothetical protein BC831DRAFT_478308 [Entophlyctis helioformis]